MNIGLKRNIRISYVYNFLLQLNITSAIWVLYLAFKGMTLVGLLAQKIGFPITFGIIAVLYIPAMVFLIIKLKKHKNREIVGGVNNDTIGVQ